MAGPSSVSDSIFGRNGRRKEQEMVYLLMWLLGVPLVVIILLWLLGVGR
jgi:hypothetical protein